MGINVLHLPSLSLFKQINTKLQGSESREEINVKSSCQSHTRCTEQCGHIVYVQEMLRICNTSPESLQGRAGAVQLLTVTHSLETHFKVDLIEVESRWWLSKAGEEVGRGPGRLGVTLSPLGRRRKLPCSPAR